MIDELKKSVSATLYERLASPLLGSFLVSWCVWNYKVFLIVFSSLEYDKKIERLDAYFSGVDFYVSFLVPLSWVVFYIFFYPLVAKYVFQRWQIYIAEKEMIRQDVKKDVPITTEQANEIRQNLAKQSVEFENRLQDKNERIKGLEARDNSNISRIEEKEKEIAGLKEQIQKLSADLNAYVDREKWINEYDISPTSNEVMRSSKGKYKGSHLCPSCLYNTPPKLIQIARNAPYNQQFIKCPSCKGEYSNQDYRHDKGSTLPHKVDTEFLCWLNGVVKHCPACAIKYKNFEFSELAKISENEYKCPLCSNSYKKSSVS